jgi:hypothetical protein
MYKDDVVIKGTIVGGTFEAIRSFTYKQRSRDVGLCTMILRLKQDNPSIQTIEHIFTKKSTPFDLWDHVTKMLYGNVDNTEDPPKSWEDAVDQLYLDKEYKEGE